MNQEHEFAPGQRVVLAPTQGRYQQTRAATVVRVTRAQVVVQPDDTRAEIRFRRSDGMPFNRADQQFPRYALRASDPKEISHG